MPPEINRSSRLESAVFYLLLAGAVLVPLAFWPSQYFAIESVKTVVIGVLTFAAVGVLSVLVMKTKAVKLPPKSMVTIGVLLALSVLASSIWSGHFMKSFFGQGFELGAGSLIITLLFAGLIAFATVAKRADRVIVLYAGIFGAFILTWLLTIIRILVGPQFISLGIFDTVTSSLVGNWFSFGVLSAVVLVISFAAIYFLKLSPKMKAAYWVLLAASFIAMFVVNSGQVWQASALVFLGLTIYLSSQKARPEGNAIVAFFKRISFVPLIITIVFIALAWQGMSIAGPVVSKLNVGYQEVVMPWRMTTDIFAGELKDQPLLGAGPNRFTQAFLAYKPVALNTTDAWGVEFNSGFGLIPTFFVTQGLVGGIVWILFFVFFGILGVESLRGLFRTDGSSETVIEPERPYARFAVVSSYAAASIIWIMAVIYVPLHAIMYLGFVLTGVWLGASAAYGRLKPLELVSRLGDRSYRVIQVVAAIVALIAFLWGLTYIKNTVALAYFGSGVQELTVASDPAVADQSFSKALALYPLDIYWQARAEAGISMANELLATVTATSTASTSSAVVTAAGDIVNKSMDYTNSAIKSDPDNYNNYVSQARVAELAAAMKMKNGYETGVAAYTNAVRRNPGNPSLYLSLARLDASQNKLDEAIQAIGASLQVKSDYIDAVYLLSQVEAAKGNLTDAITAAQFATKLNPNDPLMFFQLGLLQYNNADYSNATSSLAAALKLNPTYANAQYFLGLSDARLGKTAEAIAQFTTLAAANPDNKEIPLILSALRAGKPLFSPGPQAKAARPENSSTPPIPQK